jgi:hypothetical protein
VVSFLKTAGDVPPYGGYGIFSKTNMWIWSEGWLILHTCAHLHNGVILENCRRCTSTWCVWLWYLQQD